MGQKKQLKKRVRYYESVLAETQILYREASAKLSREQDEVRRLRDDLGKLEELSQPAFAAVRDLERAEDLALELRRIADRLTPQPQRRTTP